MPKRQLQHWERASAAGHYKWRLCGPGALMTVSVRHSTPKSESRTLQLHLLNRIPPDNYEMDALHLCIAEAAGIDKGERLGWPAPPFLALSARVRNNHMRAKSSLQHRSIQIMTPIILLLSLRRSAGLDCTRLFHPWGREQRGDD